MLEAGMKAPNFTLQDKDGNEVSLHDFAGKKVVVYFRYCYCQYGIFFLCGSSSYA